MTKNKDIKTGTIFVSHPEVRYRVVGDEGVVVRQDAAEVLVVNEVGARLLSLLDGRRSVDELVDALHREFVVGRDQLDADVRVYLAQLREAAVITECQVGSSP